MEKYLLFTVAQLQMVIPIGQTENMIGKRNYIFSIKNNRYFRDILNEF